MRENSATPKSKIYNKIKSKTNCLEVSQDAFWKKFEDAFKEVNSPVVWHGWHSEHVMQPLYNSRLIHLWATREYFIYLMQYRALRSQEMAWALLEKNDFKIDQYTPPKWYVEGDNVKKWNPDNPPKPSIYWKETIIPEYQMLSDKIGKMDVYKQISERFLKGDRKNPDNCAWSMLLYGPPGTGKSLIAENLAKALGWPLITITPSDFIRKGESYVEARAKQIFRSLQLQQDAVVLFDEIDRLLLDRDAPMYFDQHDTFQFMTPGMLVKLKDLWKSKRVIFIIATNYEERIDPAAKRKGRIDHSFLVLPPDWLIRRRILIRELIKIHMDENHNCKNDPDEIEKILTVVAKEVATFPDSYLMPTSGEQNKKKWEKIKLKTFGYTFEEIKNVAHRLSEKANVKHKLEPIIQKLKLMIKDTSVTQSLINNKNEIGALINGICEAKLDNLNPPSIRIESWLSRFNRKSEESRTKQQPFNEFMGMCALLMLSYCDRKESEWKKYFNTYPNASETMRRVFSSLGNDDPIIKTNLKNLEINKKLNKNSIPKNWFYPMLECYNPAKFE